MKGAVKGAVKDAVSALRRATLVCGLWAVLLPAAQAGRNCQAEPPTTAAVQNGLALAERTAQALDASGAQVVVLARAGQDLTRYGLRWSHLAFAYREVTEVAAAAEVTAAAEVAVAAESSSSRGR